MPLSESLLGPIAAPQAKNFSSRASQSAGASRPGDDFDSLMQARLAPRGQSFQHQNGLPSARSSSAHLDSTPSASAADAPHPRSTAPSVGKKTSTPDETTPSRGDQPEASNSAPAYWPFSSLTPDAVLTGQPPVVPAANSNPAETPVAPSDQAGLASLAAPVQPPNAGAQNPPVVESLTSETSNLANLQTLEANGSSQPASTAAAGTAQNSPAVSTPSLAASLADNLAATLSPSPQGEAFALATPRLPSPASAAPVSLPDAPPRHFSASAQSVSAEVDGASGAAAPDSPFKADASSGPLAASPAPAPVMPRPMDKSLPASAPNAAGAIKTAESKCDDHVRPLAGSTVDSLADSAVNTFSSSSTSAPLLSEGATPQAISSSLLVANAVAGTGTGVANIPLPMKNPPNANKLAGMDVKDLPVAQAGEATEKNLPTQLIVKPVRAADNGGTDFNSAFSSPGGNSSVMDGSVSLNALDLPSLPEARMRALDRTHDMVALHTMRLVESKSTELSVVIKPSIGTELSLQLRQHDGGVEVQATLLRGDHQFLSEHWADLQDRLEHRGIKLAPLVGDNGVSWDNQSGSRQQSASDEEAAQRASAFAEFAAVGQTGGATARLAVHDGWESWA